MIRKICHISYGEPEFQSVLEARTLSTDWNPAQEPNFHVVEGKRDRQSKHIAFFQGNEVIGGIRLTPIGLNLTLTEKLVDIVSAVREGIALDANRLFILPNKRGKGSLYWYLLQTCIWTMENTTATVFTALCSDRLVPLYESIGGVRLQADLLWRYDSGEKRYNFFLLGVELVRETIERRFSNELYQRKTEFSS